MLTHELVAKLRRQLQRAQTAPFELLPDARLEVLIGSALLRQCRHFQYLRLALPSDKVVEHVGHTIRGRRVQGEEAGNLARALGAVGEVDLLCDRLVDEDRPYRRF